MDKSDKLILSYRLQSIITNVLRNFKIQGGVAFWYSFDEIFD